MPSWGRHSCSSIRLFLGETLRQAKENSPGTAFGPASWLTPCWFVSGSCSDLEGPGAAFLAACLSALLSLKEYLQFDFALVKFLWTSGESLLFWWLLFLLLIQREARRVGTGRHRSYGREGIFLQCAKYAGKIKSSFHGFIFKFRDL